ncbi:hypothetical protein BA6E_10467 [Bacteroidales bacterium 6E]|nr:hypothetical protein BA6E_10467 [Bacteroidales bacterium 6E]
MKLFWFCHNELTTTNEKGKNNIYLFSYGIGSN